MSMDQDGILDVLRNVVDPEVGLDIVSLGLVYGVTVDNGDVNVSMTMTTASCPLSDVIVQNALDAIKGRFSEAKNVKVELVWEPPWTPERMSEGAKQTLGWG